MVLSAHRWQPDQGHTSVLHGFYTSALGQMGLAGFLDFRVCTLKCARGECVWSSAVMEQQWLLPGGTVLLEERAPFSCACWATGVGLVLFCRTFLVTLHAAFWSSWVVCRAHVPRASLVWSMMQRGGLTSSSQKLFPFLWTDTGKG